MIMIFNNSCFDESHLMDLVLTRIGWWIKAKWPSSLLNIGDWIRNPKESIALVGNSANKATSSSKWIPPQQGVVKLNTDAVVERSTGRAGIGGILRDYKGHTLLLFARSVGVMDVVSAEVLAVKIGCQILSRSKWAENGKLELEVDCQNAANWVQNPNSAPVCMRSMISECVEYVSRVAWSISFIPRSANGTADRLAKSGIARAGDLFFEQVVGNDNEHGRAE